MEIKDLSKRIQQIDIELKELDTKSRSESFHNEPNFDIKFEQLLKDEEQLKIERSQIEMSINRIIKEQNKLEKKKQKDEHDNNSKSYYNFDLNKEYNILNDYFADVKKFLKFDVIKRSQNRKLNTDDFIYYILKTRKLAYRTLKTTNESRNEFFILDPITNIYVKLTIHTLGTIITFIKNNVPDHMKPSKSLKNLKLDVYDTLISNPDIDESIIKPFIEAPHYLIKFPNCIMNSKTKEIYYKNSDEYKQNLHKYCFTKYKIYDYVPLNECDPQLIELLIYLINSISNNVKERKTVVEQILQASVEGYGRQKYHILCGQAGAGKSTLGNLAKLLANPELVVNFKFNDFSNNNMLNQLSENTTLVYGDDLQKNAKLLNDGISNFKILVDGQELSVEVKYEPNKTIHCTGVWLQMSNENVYVYEFNESISDRLNIIRIDGNNYRKSSDEETLAKKELINRCIPKNNNITNITIKFLQTTTAYLFENVPYFENFSLSPEMINDTQKVLDDSNWAEGFANYLEDHDILNFEVLPHADIKNLVNHYFKTDNKGGKLPNAKNIITDLETVLAKRHYYCSDNRISLEHLKKYKFNRDFIQEHLIPDVKLKTTLKSKCFIKNKPTITTDMIDDFKNNYKNLKYKNFTIEQHIIYNYLISDLKQEINLQILEFFNK